MPILMEKNQILLLKVVSVTENKKTFQKNGSPHHRHDIYLQDKQGNTSVKEYITTSPAQDKFLVDRWQYVKCLFPNERGDEIEPWDEVQDAPLKKAKEIANSLPKGTSDNAGQYQSGTEPKNCYSVKLSGESITFAFAWAKDLMVAEIGKRKAGSIVDEDADVEKIIRMAGKINHGICEYLNF